MPCDRHNEIMTCYFCGRTESQSSDQKPDRITNLANQLEDLRSMIVDMLERVDTLETKGGLLRFDAMQSLIRELQQRIETLEKKIYEETHCVTTRCGKTTLTVHATNCTCIL